MKITKEFQIQEARKSTCSNAPYQIVLAGNPFIKESMSTLTFDRDTCKRYSIPYSLDVAGRSLICSFESRQLPIKKTGHFAGRVELESLLDNDLFITSLMNNEQMSRSFGTIPPSKYTKASHLLKLNSFGDGDGIHPSPLPCPFYQITLELSESEFLACKELQPESVMRVDFHLKRS